MNIGSRMCLWGGGSSVKTWDYRVAYFQRTVSGANTGYFALPSIVEMLGVERTTAIESALTDTTFEYTVTCGFAEGSNLSGDKKIFGDVSWYGSFTYGGRWRPGGVNIWPTGPTREQFPLVGGNSVKLRIFKTEQSSGYEYADSNGRRYSYSYDQSPHNIARKQFVLVSYSDGGMVPLTSICAPTGGRFFEASTINNHPQYGFRTFWIPVVKDDAPYIADAVTGMLYPKIGGDIGIGPRVRDDWDPLTWDESVE